MIFWKQFCYILINRDIVFAISICKSEHSNKWKAEDPQFVWGKRGGEKKKREVFYEALFHFVFCST